MTTKPALYDEFGVPEYWFVDLDDDAVLVHRLVEPVQAYRPGDVLTSPLLPGLQIDVAALLTF